MLVLMFGTFDIVAIYNTVTARGWFDVAINALSIGAFTLLLVLLWRQSHERV
jgi:hypothetical protein